MFVYDTTKATVETAAPTAGFTTNGTANTLSTHARATTAAARAAAVQAIYIQGRGAGLTTISGISIRVIRPGALGTGGTAMTPRPRDASAPAASLTAFSDTSAITPGTTPTIQVAFGCGAAGPGGWVAPNPDSVILCEAGGAAAKGSFEIASGSGTISLGFDMTVEHQE
jgi:hypothetical protein